MVIVSVSLSYNEDDQRVLVVVEQSGQGGTEQDFTTRTLTQGSEAYKQTVREIVTRRPDVAIFFDEEISSF